MGGSDFSVMCALFSQLYSHIKQSTLYGKIVFDIFDIMLMRNLRCLMGRDVMNTLICNIFTFTRLSDLKSMSGDAV